MSGALAMLLALGLDAALGWPDALYRRIGHPVSWLGRLVEVLDQRLNRPQDSAARRIALGAVATAATVGTAAGAAACLVALLPGGLAGTLLTAVLAAPLLAARSLHSHVRAVQRPLSQERSDAARHAVSQIVGRDPDRLDDAGIARAALESLAENTSDGVIAPLFWGVLGGLPGLAAYKAVNTLDSMIGHRTARYDAFGRVAARLDDAANWVPARLTGLLFCLLAPRPRSAIALMRRDARRHRSPNAGWPEAAMAAALDVRLSGPRAYHDRVTQEPWLNPAAPDPDAGRLAAGLALYRRAIWLAAALLLGLALF